MNSKFILPISILIAGIVVSGAYAISKSSDRKRVADESQLLSSVRSISPGDHYYGDPKASVVLVEYSDYDCSFCASYFSNLTKIIDDLGKDGGIVWVHRNMPLSPIHPEAKSKAKLAECAAIVGGESAFWSVSEALYKLAGKPLSIPSIAGSLSLNEKDLQACMNDTAVAARIDAEYSEAFNAGARGTPFSVVITEKERFAIKESLPYLELRSFLETLISS